MQQVQPSEDVSGEKKYEDERQVCRFSDAEENDEAQDENCEHSQLLCGRLRRIQEDITLNIKIPPATEVPRYHVEEKPDLEDKIGAEIVDPFIGDQSQA